MKAITLHQPYAHLVAMSVMGVVASSWGSDYHGPIAIHAAKHRRANENIRVGEWQFAGKTQLLWTLDLNDDAGHAFSRDLHDTFGMVLAVSNETHVVPIVSASAKRSSSVWREDGKLYWAPPWRNMATAMDITSRLPYGDFSEGRYAWIFTDVEPIDPVPAKGHPWVWEWESEE